MQVRIRKLEESDAQTSVGWRNIPEIWLNTTFKATREITLQDELDWIRKVIADPAGIRFAILADDTYVGNVYLTDIHDAVAEFHIFIGDKSYWGKGVAKDASKLAIEYGMNKLNLKRIELAVKERNGAALSIYRSLGFKPNGHNGDFLRMTLEIERGGSK